MTKPLAYQLEDIEQIERWGGRGLLGWEMGLGKTFGALLYAVRNPEVRPIIVVCPATVKYQWEREAKHHFGLRAEVLGGTTPPKKGFARNRPVVIVNYEILGRRRGKHFGPGWLDSLKELQPQLVIIDESQYLGNPYSKQTKWVKQLCQGVPHVLALSGTPFQNRPYEMFSTLNILNPEQFPHLMSYAIRYCNPPEAPIWMGDFSFKPIGEVQIGDEVIGWVRDNLHPNKEFRGKEENSNHSKRRLVKTIVTDISKRMAPIVRIALASGRMLRCTPDHRWLSGKSSNSTDRFILPVRKQVLCHAIDPVLPIPKRLERMAGWLGGMMDGEGTWPLIAQSPDANPLIYKALQDTLDKLEFDHWEGASSRPGINIKGGRRAAVKFLNWCDPVKRNRIEREILGHRFITKDKIISVTPDGFGEVIGLTTETGNYIAWGYCSKNCGPKRIPWGNGWDFRGSSNLEELHQKLTNPETGVMVRRRQADVLKDLPSHRKSVVPFALPNGGDYVDALKNFRDWMAKKNPAHLSSAEKAERLSQLTALKQLVGIEKLPIVIDWVKEFMTESDGKLVLFVIHKAVVKELYSHFPSAVVVSGSVTGKARQQAVDRFQHSPKCRMLIGNIKAAGIGLDLTAGTTVAFGEYPWTPGALDQAIKRIKRIGQKKKTRSVFLVAKETIEEKLLALIGKKQKTINAVLDNGRGEVFNIMDKLAQSLLRDES